VLRCPEILRRNTGRSWRRCCVLRDVQGMQGAATMPPRRPRCRRGGEQDSENRALVVERCFAFCLMVESNAGLDSRLVFSSDSEHRIGAGQGMSLAGRSPSAIVARGAIAAARCRCAGLRHDAQQSSRVISLTPPARVSMAGQPRLACADEPADGHELPAPGSATGESRAGGCTGDRAWRGASLPKSRCNSHYSERCSEI
jgi:hypothetical protein